MGLAGRLRCKDPSLGGPRHIAQVGILRIPDIPRCAEIQHDGFFSGRFDIFKADVKGQVVFCIGFHLRKPLGHAPAFLSVIPDAERLAAVPENELLSRGRTAHEPYRRMHQSFGGRV